MIDLKQKRFRPNNFPSAASDDKPRLPRHLKRRPMTLSLKVFPTTGGSGKSALFGPTATSGPIWAHFAGQIRLFVGACRSPLDPVYGLLCPICSKHTSNIASQTFGFCSQRQLSDPNPAENSHPLSGHACHVVCASWHVWCGAAWRWLGAWGRLVFALWSFPRARALAKPVVDQGEQWRVGSVS